MTTKAGRLPPYAQRYHSPLALERMSNGLCPECGAEAGTHSSDSRFWVRPGCSLLPHGVISRIEQYRRDRIVAYTFRGANYHPQCLQLPTGEGEAFDGWALAAGVRMSVEDDLNEVAYAFRIDRTDESSYDSNDFPKVVLLDQVLEGECCFGCGQDLVEEDDTNPWEHATERTDA